MSDILYNRRTFINPLSSHYTGSISCVDGRKIINQGKELDRYSFVEISDCHGKVRIHKDANLTEGDYISKINLLINELTSYRDHLTHELLSNYHD